MAGTASVEGGASEEVCEAEVHFYQSTNGRNVVSKHNHMRGSGVVLNIMARGCGPKYPKKNLQCSISYMFVCFFCLFLYPMLSWVVDASASFKPDMWKHLVSPRQQIRKGDGQTENNMQTLSDNN